ncbi:hypothetical protein [Methylobacterium sp. WL103]|uniref:hypothetical protein n=1 Tax=Methylobacterium sp. WL103 TaxID=2603891 RepID=UPI001AED324A|nr:hypothetical protein [Methylobacterium sp. WL103]
MDCELKVGWFTRRLRDCGGGGAENRCDQGSNLCCQFMLFAHARSIMRQLLFVYFCVDFYCQKFSAKYFIAFETARLSCYGAGR